MSRRAAIVTGPGSIDLAMLDDPAPVAGEVEITVLGCGICGTNLQHLAKPELILADRRYTPGALGHEVAGRVTAVGPDVGTHHVGDLVALEPQLAGACGACPPCSAGVPWFCRDHTPLPVWGLADRLVVRAAGAWLMPSNLDPMAVTLMEPLGVSVHAIRTTHTCITRGEDLSDVSVAVLGAGATGLLAIAAARHFGVGQLICVARHDHQADLARRMGADVILRDGDAGLKASLVALAPALVVECVGGRAETLALAVAACAPRGEISVIGLFDEPQTIDTRAAFRRELRMVFPVVYGCVGRRHDFEIAADILTTSNFPFAELVTHRFALEEIARGYAVAATKGAGVVRVAIVP